jgi:transposase
MNEQAISKVWLKAFAELSEPHKRWIAAIKANEIGYGGTSIVSRATGLSRTTITQGMKDLKKKTLRGDDDGLRKYGGGRKQTERSEPLIAKAIEEILEKSSAGDPMSHLRWTGKSIRNITEVLHSSGIVVSHVTVMRILKNLGYSLRSNKKMLSGKNHPDRDAQFKYINALVSQFTDMHNPVVSVDTKKKELVGKFKNSGRIWTKDDIEVLDHDFVSYGDGKAVPYGTYDVNRNEGFVNVGMSSDTSEFAVNSLWQWWRHFGRKNYSKSTGILVCADGGGSNSSRARAWKFYIQELSNRIGIPITVAHYPPGTSKWNKIEHRMFSFISLNWKGRPLESFEAVVKLISATTTKGGLKIKARLDKKKYKKGVKISNCDFDEINVKFAAKFPQWNYTIEPI